MYSQNLIAGSTA